MEEPFAVKVMMLGGEMVRIEGLVPGMSMLDFRFKVGKEWDVGDHEMLLVFGERTFQPSDDSKSLGSLGIGHENELVLVRTPFARAKLYVAGGSDGDNCLASAEVFDITQGTWTSLPSVATKRSHLAAAVLGSRLYAFGGMNDEKKTLDSAEAFDLTTGAWVTLPPMMCCRSEFCVAVLDDKLFAIGGATGQGEHTASAEVFDPATWSWTALPPMLEGRSAHGAAVVNGKIHVIGGTKGLYNHASVEVFDPSIGAWAQLPPTATRRRSLGAAELNGNLYAVGGMKALGYGYTESLDRAEIFDSVTETWLPIPHMIKKRSNLAVAVVNSRLYAVGGFDGAEVMSSVEAFDQERGVWDELPSMQECRSNHAAAAG